MKTSLHHRVGGKDKNGITELIEIDSNSSEPVALNFSRFSHLVVTLQTSLGNYLPCTIPVHRILSERTQHQSAGQSETVNFAVEGDAELEHMFDQIQSVLQVMNKTNPQSIQSLLQNQCIDVKYSVDEEGVMMDICSGILIYNHTSIYLFIRLWLGSTRLFTHIIPPLKSVACPPFASLLP